jgi:segregation and condensation protein B
MNTITSTTSAPAVIAAITAAAVVSEEGANASDILATTSINAIIAAEDYDAIQHIKPIIEGLLLAADEPLSVDYLFKLLSANGLATLEKNQLKTALTFLANEYREQKHAIELKEVASGYRFQVRNDLAPWINKLWEEKPPRYSRAFLETLAIIAYKQPITRAEIEQVRGVSVSSTTIKILFEHGWIKIVGYKEIPGKPALYTTTNKFLDYFNLKSLAELPLLDDSEESTPIAALLATKDSMDVGATVTANTAVSTSTAPSVSNAAASPTVPITIQITPQPAQPTQDVVAEAPIIIANNAPSSANE